LPDPLLERVGTRRLKQPRQKFEVHDLVFQRKLEVFGNGPARHECMRIGFVPHRLQDHCLADGANSALDRKRLDRIDTTLAGNPLQSNVGDRTHICIKEVFFI
jgi:hypothetical protein